MNEPAPFSLKDQGKQALQLGLLSMMAFLPIWGVTMEGFSFSWRWLVPVQMALAVGVARFVWPLFSRQFSKFGQSLGKTSLLQKVQHQQELLLHPFSRIILVVALVLLPFFVSKYWLSVMIFCLIYILLGLGLNLVVGLAGLLDLGYVAFYAVGAYGYALANQYLGMGFWTALPCAALMAGLFGAVLGFPVLRMHGDYLAIVTLGFGEIIRLILNNWIEFTGGPRGIGAPPPTFFGIEFTRRAEQGGTPLHELMGWNYSSEATYIFIYLLAFAACLLMIRFFSRIKAMPLGRAWEALREDEIACRSLGINHVSTKLSAFSLGAMWGGVAGVLFAAFQGFINPSSFTFFESALILAIVVLGGMGSISGVVIAAVVLTALPEFLREFAQYRVLLFGILMVVMMIWKPRGLIQSKRQQFAIK